MKGCEYNPKFRDRLFECISEVMRAVMKKGDTDTVTGYAIPELGFQVPGRYGDSPGRPGRDGGGRLHVDPGTWNSPELPSAHSTPRGGGVAAGTLVVYG